MMASRPVLTKRTREICECWPDDMNTQSESSVESDMKRGDFNNIGLRLDFYLENLLLVFKLYMAMFPLMSVIR